MALFLLFCAIGMAGAGEAETRTASNDLVEPISATTPVVDKAAADKAAAEKAAADKAAVDQAAAEKAAADKAAAEKAAAEKAASEKAASEKAAADKAAAKKAAADRAAAERAAEEKAAQEKRSTFASTGCDQLEDEAVRISAESDETAVTLLKVRSVRVVQDNRNSYRPPTGSATVLVLSCTGVGVWSDGDEQTRVLMTLKVDSDGDAFVYYEGVA